MAEQYFLISVAIEQPIERPPYRGWDFGYYAIKEPVIDWILREQKSQASPDITIIVLRSEEITHEMYCKMTNYMY